jgi:hypothetical protein
MASISGIGGFDDPYLKLIAARKESSPIGMGLEEFYAAEWGRISGNDGSSIR